MDGALDQAIGYMQQAKANRFRDVLNRLHDDAMPSATPGGPASMIGGPTPDPAWDAFFGAMDDTGGRIRMKQPPSIRGLMAASQSPLDTPGDENPRSPLNTQYFR